MPDVLTTALIDGYSLFRPGMFVCSSSFPTAAKTQDGLDLEALGLVCPRSEVKNATWSLGILVTGDNIAATVTDLVRRFRPGSVLTIGEGGGLACDTEIVNVQATEREIHKTQTLVTFTGERKGQWGGKRIPVGSSADPVKVPLFGSVEMPVVTDGDLDGTMELYALPEQATKTFSLGLKHNPDYSRSIMFGAYCGDAGGQASIDAYELLTGNRLDLWLTFCNTPSVLPDLDLLAAMIARGTTPIITLQTNGWSQASINAGTHDAALTAWLTHLAPVASDIIIRPWHEPNGNWYSHGVPTAWATGQQYDTDRPITNSGTMYLCAIPHTSGTFATDLAAGKWVAQASTNSAAGFKSMWTRLHNLAATAAPGLRFMLCFNNFGSSGWGAFSDYKPSDSEFDCVALDGYCDAGQSFASVFWQPLTDLRAQVSSTKPCYIAETGARGVTNPSSDYADGLFNRLLPPSARIEAYQSIVGVCWFHRGNTAPDTGTYNWRLDQTPALLNSWKLGLSRASDLGYCPVDDYTHDDTADAAAITGERSDDEALSGTWNALGTAPTIQVNPNRGSSIAFGRVKTSSAAASVRAVSTVAPAIGDPVSHENPAVVTGATTLKAFNLGEVEVPAQDVPNLATSGAAWSAEALTNSSTAGSTVQVLTATPTPYGTITTSGGRFRALFEAAGNASWPDHGVVVVGIYSGATLLWTEILYPPSASYSYLTTAVHDTPAGVYTVKMSGIAFQGTFPSIRKSGGTANRKVYEQTLVPFGCSTPVEGLGTGTGSIDALCRVPQGDWNLLVTRTADAGEGALIDSESGSIYLTDGTDTGATLATIAKMEGLYSGPAPGVPNRLVAAGDTEATLPTFVSVFGFVREWWWDRQRAS